MMSAAWDHNPQGEFHELAADGTTIIHWRDLLLVGGAAFAAGFVICAWAFGLVGALVYGLVRLTMFIRARAPRGDRAT